MYHDNRANLFSDQVLDEMGYTGEQRAALRCLAFRAPATEAEQTLEREFIARYDRLDAVATRIWLVNQAQERRARYLLWLAVLAMVVLSIAAVGVIQGVMGSMGY